MFTTTRRNSKLARPRLEVSHRPVLLTVTEAAEVLGFKSHDVRILVVRGLLKPLEESASTKYFAFESVIRLIRDEVWLEPATIAVATHCRG